MISSLSLHAQGAGELIEPSSGRVDRPDAAAAAVDEAVVLEAGAHTEAGLAGDEELGLVVHHLDHI
jgi:hypothetical protein